MSASSAAASSAGVRKLRWGFLPCTSAIAKKNYHAIKASASSELVAVASRSLASAQAWCAERGESGVRCHGSYEALLADPGVDAVYLPLPTALHLRWVLAAAAAGKHVLLEKPTALSLAELQAMVAACARAGVLFSDGVMYMHHARLPAMLAVARGGELGPLRRLDSGFSFAADAAFLATNIRMDPAMDALGCLGDLGWYQARFALLAFEGEMPLAASAHAHARSAGGVPIDVSFTLHYAGEARVAVCDCSFRTAFRQWLELSGEAGVLRCDDFVIPRTTGPGSAVHFTVTTGAGTEDDHRRVLDTARTETVRDACQEAAMFEAFSAAALRGAGAGADAAADSWPRLALQTQAIMDACMASMAAGGARTAVAEPIAAAAAHA